MAQSAVLLAVDAVAAACKRQSVRIRRNAGRTVGDYSIALRTAMCATFYVRAAEDEDDDVLAADTSWM